MLDANQNSQDFFGQKIKQYMLGDKQCTKDLQIPNYRNLVSQSVDNQVCT